MRVFATKNNTLRWHYLTAKAIKKYLSKFPYLDREKQYCYFAYCPFCKQPIQIISRVSNEKDKLDFYAKHLSKSPKGFDELNQKRALTCLLRKHTSSFIPTLTKTFEFKNEEINISVLRRSLNFYTGIYFCLFKGKEFSYLRNVDQFNFPFALLIAIKKIYLNGRKVANPNINKAISQNSNYFYLDKNNQIQNKDGYNDSNLIMTFKLLPLDPNLNWPKMQTLITENLDGVKAEIYRKTVYCRSLKNLIRKKG
jgi:hypothetical protein